MEVTLKVKKCYTIHFDFFLEYHKILITFESLPVIATPRMTPLPHHSYFKLFFFKDSFVNQKDLKAKPSI